MDKIEIKEFSFYEFFSQYCAIKGVDNKTYPPNEFHLNMAKQIQDQLDNRNEMILLIRNRKGNIIKWRNKLRNDK